MFWPVESDAHAEITKFRSAWKESGVSRDLRLK
jgi:hypothetical protein